MKTHGRTAAALANPSIIGLMGIVVTCLLAVLGVKLLFDHLQAELYEKSVNERARLFVGEEIVRGIQGAEKAIYRMVATTSEPGLARVHRDFDATLDKLEHDLQVLKDGGTVQRMAQLNIEGRENVVLQATYRSDTTGQDYVMELIEISPLLEQIRKKPHDLEGLLLQRQGCLSRNDSHCLLSVLPEIALFLKQIPPYFERINENANRLFLDSSERLRGLEEQIIIQSKWLKRTEMGLITLVIFLAGFASILFVRRINQASQELTIALDEMRSAKEAAERASRAKSEFVSRMSHELRTPLNAIIGFAELLEDEPLEHSQRNYVDLINGSGKHLLELINAVLDHAKIEAGGLTLEKVAFDLPAAIAAVRSIVNERASAKGLEFIDSVAADLPRYVIGDPTRLRQVLINLSTNAVKFTEHGSVELRVAIDEGRMIFSIRDTGIGMDEAALARLFKPFSQADDTVTRKFGGTGLGLIISKDLIEAMGGQIEVESAPGVGSVFWFWLPLQVTRPVQLAAGTATAPTSQADLASLVAGQVLLVDDNRVNQQLAGAMLDRLKLAHDFADNGTHALQQIAATDYALILMDMEMPEMDGVTATLHIREREKTLGLSRKPIIAMTANAMREDQERCFAAGMDGYVSKPVNLASLRAEIVRLFGANAAETAATGNADASATVPGGGGERARALEMMWGDEALLEEVAGMFVADLPGYLKEMDSALADGDAERFTRSAHTLKGLCATFGAEECRAIGQLLEQTARSGDLAACGDLAVSMRTHCEALAVALRA